MSSEQRVGGPGASAAAAAGSLAEVAHAALLAKAETDRLLALCCPVEAPAEEGGGEQRGGEGSGEKRRGRAQQIETHVGGGQAGAEHRGLIASKLRAEGIQHGTDMITDAWTFANMKVRARAGWLHCFRSGSNSNMLTHSARRCSRSGCGRASCSPTGKTQAGTGSRALPMTLSRPKSTRRVIRYGLLIVVMRRMVMTTTYGIS